VTLAHAFVLFLGGLAATAALSWQRAPDAAHTTLAGIATGLAAAAGVYLFSLLIWYDFTEHLALHGYEAPVVFSLLCGLPAGVTTAVRSKGWLRKQQVQVGSTAAFRWVRWAVSLSALLVSLTLFGVVMNARLHYILDWFGRWCADLPASECSEVGVPERLTINVEYLLPWFLGHLLLLWVACVLVGRGVFEALANRRTGASRSGEGEEDRSGLPIPGLPPPPS
jgi:hypothetical protein